jgi:hypothetical protein
MFGARKGVMILISNVNNKAQFCDANISLVIQSSDDRDVKQMSPVMIMLKNKMNYSLRALPSEI